MVSGPNFEFRKIIYNFWHQDICFRANSGYKMAKKWIYKNVSKIVKIVHSANYQPTRHLILQSKHKLSVQLCNNAILVVPWDTQHHQNSNFRNTIYQFISLKYVVVKIQLGSSRDTNFLKMSFIY